MKVHDHSADVYRGFHSATRPSPHAPHSRLLRRASCVVAGTAVVVGATAGCNASPSPAASAPASAKTGTWTATDSPVDIMGWSAGDEVATARVSFVKQQMPSLTLEPDHNGFDQQKFATTMAAGSAPAGVSMDRQLLATYAAKGLLMPLDECVSSQHINLNQFYPQAIEESTWNGHLYGIPEFFTTRGMYVDSQALAEAGLAATDVTTSDWAALEALAAKLYRVDGGHPSRIGFDPKIPEFLPLWAIAAGGNIVAKDGKPTLDSPAVVKALEWAVGIINDQGGWAAFKSFRDSWDFFGADNEFAKNQVGAMPYEQWYVNVLATAGSASKFTVVPIQALDGTPTTLETGSAFAIPRGSPNAGGMCAVAKAMTSTEAWMAAAQARDRTVQDDHSAFTGIFTANKAATEEIRQKYVSPTGNPDLDQAIATFYDSLESAAVVPPSPVGQQVQQAYEQAVLDALSGTDPAEALHHAQATAEQAFKDATR